MVEVKLDKAAKNTVAKTLNLSSSGGSSGGKLYGHSITVCWQENNKEYELSTDILLPTDNEITIDNFDEVIGMFMAPMYLSEVGLNGEGFEMLGVSMNLGSGTSATGKRFHGSVWGTKKSLKDETTTSALVDYQTAENPDVYDDVKLVEI